MKKTSRTGKRAKIVTVDDYTADDYEIVEEAPLTKLERDNKILRHDCDALREELYRRNEQIARIPTEPFVLIPETLLNDFGMSRTLFNQALLLLERVHDHIRAQGVTTR